ncbi:MAG: O-antigen ligase family protein [Rhodothermales bacterium]
MYVDSLISDQFGSLAAPAERALRGYWIVLFVVVHPFLGLLMFQYEFVATGHALATLAIGLWWAIRGRWERVLYTGAYLVGAEVLWRMTNAQVFWEYGKYAISLLFVIALIRARRLRVPLLPLFFFVLLLPSVWFTTENIEPGLARGLISFNMSGPLALFICSWFFFHTRITRTQMVTMLLGIIAPVLSIAAIASFNTFSSSDITFGTVSNVTTSGGFGPNQVSSMLGFGGVAAFFYLLLQKKVGNMHRGFFIGLMLLFIFQCALTFSRGGLVLALGAGTVAILFLFRDGRSRTLVVVLAILLFIFTEFVMLPFMDDFTGGAFLQRYSETSTTGRVGIALVDIKIWQDHPFFGVGPGRSSVYREFIYGVRVAAHTEFTRLVAEHGTFGVIALFLLFYMGWRNHKRRIDVKSKAIFVSLLTWVFLFMLVNAFRLVAPAFAFGITFTTIMGDAWRLEPGTISRALG